MGWGKTLQIKRSLKISCNQNEKIYKRIELKWMPKNCKISSKSFWCRNFPFHKILSIILMFLNPQNKIPWKYGCRRNQIQASRYFGSIVCICHVLEFINEQNVIIEHSKRPKYSGKFQCLINAWFFCRFEMILDWTINDISLQNFAFWPMS